MWVSKEELTKVLENVMKCDKEVPIRAAAYQLKQTPVTIKKKSNYIL